MKNILVIGVGPHTRRNHLPALAAGHDAGLVGTVTGVDVPAATAAPVAFGPGGRLPTITVDPFDPGHRTLPAAVRDVLDAAVRARRIDAVVVATEPSFHLVYTLWALQRGLSVLLDKPLTVNAGCSTDPSAARAIAGDYQVMMDAYHQALRQDPRILVSVASQRRHHPAFRRIRALIAEVAEQTGCPVTSLQSFHSDGQWRLPNELVDLTYHGFDRGYGKAAHSGYHFFDIVPWLLAAGETDGKALDTVEVYANITRPGDLLAQLGVADHERLFPQYAAANPYTEAELVATTRGFGEVDAFISMAYRSRGRTMTLGSINLVHNGFSQRGTAAPHLGDLYKGNGRIGHETHIIEQGPLQVIHFHLLQTLPGPNPSPAPAAAGAEDHIEVHVFRNDRLRPNWPKHTRLDFDALTADATVPTQFAARRAAMREFLLYLNDRRIREQMASDLAEHRRGATLMAGAYLSMAQQWIGGQPVAVLGFTQSSGSDGAPCPRHRARLAAVL